MLKFSFGLLVVGLGLAWAGHSQGNHQMLFCGFTCLLSGGTAIDRLIRA